MVRFRHWRYLIFLLLGLSVAAVGVAALLVGYLLTEAWPEAKACDLTVLEQAQQPMVIIGQDETIMARVVSENRIIVPLDKVSPRLINAVTAAEDKNFYSNWGFDLHGTARAFLADMRHKRVVQGGSTITQQLAKHMIDEHGRSLRRKLVELEVSWRLTRTYSKSRILELYLNEVYWGSGFYGIEAASEGYFHVHASDLNDAQSAVLAGLIRAPNTNSPFHNLRRALYREKDVLLQMKDTGRLSGPAYRAALDEPLGLGTPEPPKGLDSYASATVVHALDDLIASGAWYRRQGVEVHTTFLPALQHWTQEESIQYLDSLRHATNLPMQAAILVVDNATGGILAETGGYSYRETPFDRNWSMHRPAGTMLFPWILAAALSDRSLSPASMVDVRPITPATAAPATGFTMSLPLQDLVSVDDAGGMARLTGNISGQAMRSVFGPPAPSDAVDIATGTRPLTPTQVALFFSSLDQHGRAGALHCLENVSGAGSGSYNIPLPADLHLLPAEVADQTAATLASSSINGMAETISPGQNHEVAYGGFSVNGHDAWYAGTDGPSTVVVWIGCDAPQSLPAVTDFSRVAYPLWDQVMRETRLERATPDTPLMASANLKMRVIRRSDGLPVERLDVPVAGTTMVFLTPEEARHMDQAAATQATQLKSSDWQTLLEATEPSLGHEIKRPLYAAWQDRPVNVSPQVEETLPALLPTILTSDNQWIATSTVGEQDIYPWDPVDSAATNAGLLAAAQLDLGHLGITPETAKSAFEERRFSPVVINPYISPLDVPSTALPPKTTLLPSIGRYYPNGTLYAHLIGSLQLLRRPSANGPPQRDEVFYSSWQGVSGLEGIASAAQKPDDAGMLRITCGPFGYAQKYTVARRVSPARVLTTTLQQDLQQALHAAMSPVVSGSGVVMDADDGSIIAMVSKPDFDPNILLNAGSTAWKQLAAAPWDPLLNKATELQGPPGSTFKVVTSLVALRSGALQTNENIPLGSIALPGVNYNFPKEQGVATFQDALAQSRDSYFMRVGLRVGSQALTAGAREMGLGSPTGFPMAEASGLVPDDAFMLKHHQRRLGLGDAANLSIGQGDLTVTPIQMAVVYASLVNGGIRWKPHLWLGEAPVAQGRIDLPPGVDQAIMAGLHQVTVDGTGTAAQVDGFDTWGKTGTAQVGSKDKPRQLAWFCGGFTHNDHHYVAAILTEGSVDELIYGGGTSAEVFGQMLRNWSTHDVLPAKLQIVQVTPPASGSVPVAPPADDSAAPTDAATLIIDPAPAVAGVITPGDISDMTVPEVYPAGDTDTPPRALPVNPGTPDATTAPSP